MEPSSDDPFASPPEAAPQAIEELSGIIFGRNEPTNEAYKARRQAWLREIDLNSDPLGENTPFRATNAASANEAQGHQKREPSGPIDNDHIDKTPRIDETIDDPSLRLILEARDLLIRAYTVTQTRDKQARILDLLEIFREYTEQGRIRYTSTILASQVANLEQIARKIENQTRQQVKNLQNAPKQPQSTQLSQQATQNSSSWAKIAELQTLNN